MDVDYHLSIPCSLESLVGGAYLCDGTRPFIGLVQPEAPGEQFKLTHYPNS